MKYIFLLFVLFVISGCQEEELTPFTSQRFIKFKFFTHSPGTEYWRINYTFSLDKDDVQQVSLSIPVEFNGYSLTESLPYAVRVVTDSTTMPADCYELQLEQSFRSGIGNIDSLHISLLRAPVLKEEVKRLRIELVSNAAFKTFMPDSSFIDIYAGDILMIPTWWDESVTRGYLGTYSDKKLLAFVACTGIKDFGILEPSAKRYYALMFKREVEEKKLTEADGRPMEIPISG